MTSLLVMTKGSRKKNSSTSGPTTKDLTPAPLELSGYPFFLEFFLELNEHGHFLQNFASHASPPLNTNKVITTNIFQTK